MLDITEDDSATDLIIGLTAGTGGRAQIRSVAQSDGTSSALSFHTMTGSNTSEALRITPSGSVGVGNSSPSYLIHADAATATDPSYITASSGSDFIVAIGSQNSPGVAQEAFVGTLSNDALKIKTNNTERLRITNGGRLGIGTNSPSTLLHLGGTAPGDSIIRQDSTASGTNWEIGERVAGKWQIFEDDTDSIVATFQSNGNVGIGQSSPATKLDVNGGLHGDHATFSSVAGRGLKISTESRAGQNDGIGVLDAQDTEGSKGIISLQSGGTETARVTTSQVLIGQTSGSAADVGVIFQKTGNMFATVDGGTSGYFRRLTNNGEVIRISKNTTRCGSIGVNGTALFVASQTGNDSGLKFGDRQVVPCTTGGAARDDAINLGSSSNRFDTIHAKATSITTSDRNEKQDIELLSDAEMRVAKAAKGLLRKYRWKSSVAEKATPPIT